MFIRFNYFFRIKSTQNKKKEDKRQLINQYAGVIAERVMMKEGQSAQVKLQRAFQREQEKSAASRKRGEEFVESTRDTVKKVTSHNTTPEIEAPAD